MLSGVASVTNPVSMHLKELNAREVRGLQTVVDLQIGAVGDPLSVEFGCVGGGDVTAANGCFRSAEITDEITSKGGWHIYHEISDCDWLDYLREKKERKCGCERSNRRDASSAIVLSMLG